MSKILGYVGSAALLVAGDFSRLVDVVVTDENHARCFAGLTGSCDRVVPYVYPVEVRTGGLAVADWAIVDVIAQRLGFPSHQRVSHGVTITTYSAPDDWPLCQHPRIIEELRRDGYAAIHTRTVMTNYDIEVVIPLIPHLVRVGQHLSLECLDHKLQEVA